MLCAHSNAALHSTTLDHDITLQSGCQASWGMWVAAGLVSAAEQTLCHKGLHLCLHADPARRGLSAAVVRWLLACGARTIVYVSCHLATQVRRLSLSVQCLPAGMLATSVMPGARADLD